MSTAVWGTNAQAQTVSITQYGGVGDGVTNNRNAFQKAFSKLTPGMQLDIPAGTYLVDTTWSPLTVPAGVRVVGSLNKTKIIVACTDAPTNYHALWQNGGNNIQINYISFVRTGDFNIVMFPVNSYSVYQWNADCINGDVVAGDTHYCDAFEFGVQSGTISKFDMYGCGVTEFNYGLFEPCSATTTVTDTTVTNTSFHNDTSDDLEFNSPGGVCSGVYVKGCSFKQGGEFAVGLANVQDASITDCTFSGYNSEAIHIEDRSSGVDITDNTLSSCGLTKDSYIQIINNSSGIDVSDNTLNANSNTDTINLINVEPGGNYAPPSDVSVDNNTFELGAKQNGVCFADIPSGVTADSNTVSAVPGVNLSGFGIEFFHCPGAEGSDNTFTGLVTGLFVNNN